MRSAVTGILCLTASLPFAGFAQLPADTLALSSRLSSKYIQSMGDRSETVSAKMDQQTTKYLNGLKNQEAVLQKRLSKIDTSAARRIFAGSQQQYDKLQNDLKNNSARVLNSFGRYVPGMDTAITSLKFLQQGALANPKLAGQVTRIQASLSKVNALEDQFKKSDNVEDFIKQREQYLQQQLSAYNLGSGLQQYKQKAAYYVQTISDLRQSWDDPSRMEQKAMTVLNALPAFQNFMQKESMIAGLFNIPGNYATSGLAGLQTRDQVQQLMQQKMTTMGPNGGQTAQQNIGNAQSSLTTLRNKLQQYGSGGGNMPDVSINSQHTKTFLKRLVYGISAQSSQSTYLWPASTNFALTVGYKLNKKSTVGVGLNYAVGWGEPISHIKISNQAIGFLAYLDVQIKGSFFASGEADYNYNNVFESLNQLKAQGLWQPAALIGISKIISLKGNFVKQTKVQLFWNPLSYTPPRSQPFLFKVGYNF